MRLFPSIEDAIVAPGDHMQKQRARVVIARLLAIGALATGAVWLRAHDARSDAAATTMSLAQFERLSYDLRGRRLDDAERKAIEAELAKGDKAASDHYASRVDAWLTKDGLKGFVSTFLRFPPVAVINPDSETYFHRLAVQAGPTPLYFLPYQAKEGGKPPCAESEAVSVQAWWSKTPVRVCASSYVPEKIFDSVGYCQGEGEPLMRQPPRAGCGCGPMLMGCLPPAGEDANLDKLVKESAASEWFETAQRLVAEGEPLDALVTTTKTWQNGVAEFLYARREAIADHKKAGWSPALEQKIAERFGKIDIRADGRWVQRSSTYEGSGLWWTSLAVGALKVPVRPAAHHLLERHLCMVFTSVNVDADSMLAAVGDREENLRTLSSLIDTPMRKQDGCKGCHAPMDGAAAFFGVIQGPLYGSYVTGERPKGEFYISGARDFRGHGVGTAALAKFVVESPEFETCSVRRAFEQVFQRPPTAGEAPVLAGLVGEFRSNGHRWLPILKTLLKSDAYLYQDRPPVPPPAAEPMTAVPEGVAKFVDKSCRRCHKAQSSLDLSKVPAPTEVEVWKNIWTRVNDSSMPPRKEQDKSLKERFPIDPQERKAFLASVGKMLGPALDAPVPPRRIAHGVWLSVVKNVAVPSLGPDAVAAVLDKLPITLSKVPPRGLPPPYVLALERVSESICRNVALADDKARRYGIAAGDWSKEAKDKAVGTLMAAVYGKTPSAADLASEVGQLDELKAATGDWREAWIGLCSTQLSGPRLLFGDYAGKAAR